MTDDFVVTPWNVEGDIDYDKLIKRFGTQKITSDLLTKIEKFTKESHFMLRRGIFFSHRDLNRLLDDYEKGKKFFLYTGRGPSGHTHIGHLVPWVFAKWLQDKFGAKMYFQLTDDEKFWSKKDMTLEQGIAAAKDCIKELRIRFMINQHNFMAKVVTKDGIKIVNLDA